MATNPIQAVDAANAAAKRAADAVHAGPLSRSFTQFSSYIAGASGRPATFVLAFLTIIVWAVTGPVFHYSDTWQLVINTGTTIITFLMVFLIQNTQNRDGAALQAKLDELIRAHHEARNTYMGIEKLPEEELTELREHCAETASDSSPAQQTTGT
jgi:low affinity Fe/Cu permease